jgi:endonuclease/exonuclease/phosphatase family metal-dependent hydrolase
MSRTACTILTLNIFHDLPMHRQLQRRCELIARAIAAHRPHLAALQEVMRSTGSGDIGAALRDRVNRLCRGEVYRLDYAAADGAGDGAFSFDEGVAMLSRLEADGPVQSLKYRAQVELATELAGQRYRLPDDRIAIRRRFRLANGVALDFYVSHLTDRPECIDGVAVRTRQARELAEWTAEGSSTQTTVVLAGDFNDVPDSETIASLRRAGFIDLHEVFGSGPGCTNDRDDIDLNGESATHNQRIDYLMMRPAKGHAPEVTEMGLFANQPHRESDGTWLWCSDHIGVSATLWL